MATLSIAPPFFSGYDEALIKTAEIEAAANMKDELELKLGQADNGKSVESNNLHMVKGKLTLRVRMRCYAEAAEG